MYRDRSCRLEHIARDNNDNLLTHAALNGTNRHTYVWYTYNDKNARVKVHVT